ncbi:guanine deaminase [Neptunomonas sp. XY-337]|uniref:guanine deaminase n=1 Tax=Neptunomonas sp. XY-337 TaxID=2561897 RepID=UPI0010AA40FF|nr:guanine deaminase [Neptunomonas sp. XY-337]
MTASRHAYRAAIIHMLDDPASSAEQDSYEYFQDGLLVVSDGKIVQLGEAEQILRTLPADVPITHYPNHLLTAGFVDTHIHYPQTEMIASYGEQLLDWLNNYTFPTEQAFADADHAKRVATLFLDELMRNGTTTALVFGTVHPESVDAFFTVAQQRKLRMICGKVMMDRNAPDYLTDTPEQSYTQSKQLIEKWHHKDRLAYAVTPRFAPTSTPAQLDQAARLLSEYEGLYLHTHLAENKQECAWVSELFPTSESYLDVYKQHNLLGKRSVFAHGIHLNDTDCCQLRDSESAIAFCPTSNLFLGSGLFNLPMMEQHDVAVGLGTDVGAGTSFSMLQTLNEAYKVMQLQDAKLSPLKSLYLATLGGARALHIDDKVGNLTSGSEADFIVLDLNATPLISARMANASAIEEQLFVLMMLGDDRAIEATYVSGDLAWRKPSA